MKLKMKQIIILFMTCIAWPVSARLQRLQLSFGVVMRIGQHIWKVNKVHLLG